ncbi:MAG: hypothetical protein A3A04_01295 [Candidatus Harrisonbacteria bacterium RIFCSPLOWO2_01_FULL_40_28]|uniref:DUF5667 domain-containing protein n=1 Tax=Candidatus Harrisonbacteria bacterium RIFCSPLOWO2_01_FULL_40_28 TaxID=1798406 RepID=A0A1G1ZKB1_9BACT|nr:MAG: hypothetical protein A3A04_01295 [Candidatus Harrisonbacteria bacterium RIFCSPLOWO2_01_FULL_40_28]
MKTFFRILVLLIVISLSFFSNSYVSAHDGVDHEKEVAYEQINLGIDDPGVLPTGRLYFAKEWSRGFRQFFTFNPFKKAELDLSILNEKAAELQKIAEDDKNSFDTVLYAVDQYEISLNTLEDRILGLKVQDGQANLDRFLVSLTNRLAKHNDFLAILKVRFETSNDSIQEKIGNIQNKLTQVFFSIPLRLKNNEGFFNELRALQARRVTDDRVYAALHDIRLAAFLDRAYEVISRDNKTKHSELKLRIVELEDIIFTQFNERIYGLRENNAREFLSQVIEYLDYETQLYVFEKFTVGTDKNRELFQQLSTDIIKNPGHVEELDRNRSLELVEKAELMFGELVSKIMGLEDLSTKQSLEGRLALAASHINDTKNALKDKESNYGEVVGRITASLAIMKKVEQDISEITESSALTTKTIMAPQRTLTRVWKVGILSGGEFRPEELKIKKGDTVVWINLDSMGHWISERGGFREKGVCDEDVFDSCKVIGPNEKFEFIFNYEGTWHYRDYVNPNKEGVIVVEE